MRCARAVIAFAVTLLAAALPGAGGTAQRPRWRSVEVQGAGVNVRAAPSARAPRRGTVQEGTRLPLLGRVAGPGCPDGRWVQIGPDAFVCDLYLRPRPSPPEGDRLPRLAPGALTPRTHAFIHTDGTWAYAHPSDYFVDDWVESLGRGFGVAVVERAELGGVEFARTLGGLWVRVADLRFARPSGFHGWTPEEGDAFETVAWVVRGDAPIRRAPGGRVVGRATRLQRVRVEEQARGFVRTADGWLAAAHLRRPTLASRPSEVGPEERWLDVDPASQTLLAMVGDRPVFATLVSTGRAATPTPRGVHRVWVKLAEDDMDDLEREDVVENYAIQAVPWVQYFEGSNGLHAAFWHDRFGHPRSHGCVNLAPRDAAWLFAFTQPGLPAGWDAILPVPSAPGTVIRVR
jgi:hypothetical protein